MKNKEKIYPKKAIALGTFLGSPLVAGYLMAKNYKSWGDEASAKWSVIGGFATTLIIVSAIILLPDEIISMVPNFLIPLIYTAIVQVFVEYYQGEQIELHLANGYTKESNWKAAGFGIVGGIIVLSIFLSISIYQPLYPGDLKTYGSQQHEIYFDENVTPPLSDSLAFSLYRFGYFDNSLQSAAHIGRRDEYYVITLPLQKQVWNNDEVMDAMQALKDDIKTKFNTGSIIIRMHHIGYSKDEFEEL